MARRYLIVIDMQNDFVTGTLGTTEAQGIAPAVVKPRARSMARYSSRSTPTAKITPRRRKAETSRPPLHQGLRGLAAHPRALRRPARAQCPPSSRSRPSAPRNLSMPDARRTQPSRLSPSSLSGVCTDICVVSNALLIKAALPEVPVRVDARLCAGVTPDAHQAALATMRSCQVQVAGA